jgi:hypothetical protein
MARGVVPEDVLSALPATEGIELFVPTLEQINTSIKAINDNWNSVVGVTIAE